MKKIFPALVITVSQLLVSCSTTTPPLEHDINISSSPLYAEAIPGAIVSADLERVKHRRNNNLMLEKITFPTLTAYIPGVVIENKTLPAVIICPGGGYGGLSMYSEGRDIATRFAQSGVAAFVLKYRMPLPQIMEDSTLGPLQDIQHAIKLIRKNHVTWKINPDNVGVMGFSAGGHLAASAAVHDNHPVVAKQLDENLKPDFQVLIYPVISFQDGITHKGSRRNLLGSPMTKEKIDFFSNERHVRVDAPPAFIVHATDDKAVPVENAFVYHKALTQHNVNSQLLILPNGGHGFGLANKFDWFDSLIKWMDASDIR